MAGFVFKLEPLLRHRRLTEDQRQRDVAQLLRQRMILQTQLRTARETVRQGQREGAEQRVGRVDVMGVRRHAAHASEIAGRTAQLERKLASMDQEVEQAREKLLHATRQRKVVELLRERHRERWVREQARRETAELDEAAMQRYMRLQREAAA